MTVREDRTAGRRRAAARDTGARLLDGLPVTERRLQCADVSTTVLEGGDGPPVVLLHGPGAYGAAWLRVIPRLVATHRVIAPDLPGHGTSEVAGGRLDAARVIAWLDELIERTCPVSPAVVGNTLGGAIAARFAVDHSERVGRLVLVDALGLRPFQPTPGFESALIDFLTEPNEGTHDRLWRHCAFDLDALRVGMGERWETFSAYNLDRARTPGVMAALQILMAEFGVPAIPSSDLARIAVPTTLIWGRHDRATALQEAEAASARYRWALHVINNAADDPAIEQPEAFLAALSAALRRVDPNGRKDR
jgi:pimeloyl-ACP methyl ester carboxylesterase